MEKLLKRGLLNDSYKPKKKEDNSQKKGDTKREGQVVSDKQASSSTSNKRKDLCRRACEEFDRSNKRLKAVPSSYEIEVHPSMNLILQEVLADCRKKNQNILEQNSIFSGMQAKHLEKSKQEISQTAQFALGQVPGGQPKEALLLGIGNALDIPLPELAEKFDHLTVVDMDNESAKGAIEKLSPDLQKKIKLVVADISGIVGKISNEIQHIGNNSNSKKEYFERALAVIKEINGKFTESVPDFGQNYAFVCSHLVLTQLLNSSYSHILNVANSKYGHSDIEISDFQQEMGNLRMYVQQTHIDSLAKSVSPQGTVHFADTYMADDHNGGPIQSMVYSQIDNAIEEKFVSTKKDTLWAFKQSPQLEFAVVSHRLQPKREE